MTGRVGNALGEFGSSTVIIRQLGNRRAVAVGVIMCDTTNHRAECAHVLTRGSLRHKMMINLLCYVSPWGRP